MALDLAQAMPLVERALGVLERREVRPQLGLLKITMLQLDSTFNEKAYGASSFTDFVEKLQKADYVEVTGGEGRYMIRMKGGGAPEKPGAKPEEAIPLLRDVLEMHRLEVDNGAAADELAEWVQQEHPNFDWREYGFQEFSELLNYAQDKGLVRIQADEEKGPDRVPRRRIPSAGRAARARTGGARPKTRRSTSRSRWCPASRPRPARFRFRSCRPSCSAVRARRARPRAAAKAARRSAALRRVRARRLARRLHKNGTGPAPAFQRAADLVPDGSN